MYDDSFYHSREVYSENYVETVKQREQYCAKSHWAYPEVHHIGFWLTY